MSTNLLGSKLLARIFVLVALALVIGTGGLYANHAAAGANTFVVTKEADTNDGSCDETDCSVREAFVAANAASPAGIASGPVIQIPAGTYKIEISGVDEQASATGDFDVTGNLTVIGAGPDATFLDGNSLDRLIDVRDTGSLNISGLTIQHGQADAGGTAGLRADGPLVMTNVHVVNNTADGTSDDGVTGGVTVRHAALIVDSVISDNVVTGNSTGGLFGTDTSNVTVRNTLIERNSATGDFPSGGVVLQGQGLLHNVTVKDNTASGKEPLAGLFIGKLAIVTIRGSLFLNNDTTGDLGVGGIFNRGQLTVWDTTIDGNDAGKGGVGGLIGIANDDKTSTITLRRVTITNNTALGQTSSGDPATGGAAIDDMPVTMGEVTIDHNSARDNATGGLKFFGASPVQLDRVQITNNSATTDATGGLFAGGGSHVTVTDSWIDNNSTGGNATGGAYVTGNSTVDLNRVAITNNSADGELATGGIGTYQASATLRNVTVSGNSAGNDATAGVYVDGGTLTIDFTTINNNTAGNQLGVGGITNYGTVNIKNSIVGNNPAPENCYDDNGALTSIGHNIDFGSTCGFNTATDHSNINPNLSPLADHGGFSPTHAIVGPPALNAGDCGSVILDQRVVPRPQGSACDIGSFEFGSFATTTREWGDLLCANGAGPDDALVLIAQGAGIAAAGPAGAACPGVGDDTYVGGWFLHRPWGDFNCSGLVDILDALAILQGVVNISYPSDTACPKVGDQVEVGIP
jgi:hypothetical protein